VCSVCSVCSVSFNVCVVVYCVLSERGVLFSVMCVICVMCLTVVLLSMDKNQFAVKIIIIIIIIISI
jgi:hypothetical protein